MYIRKKNREGKEVWADMGSACAGNNSKDFHAVTMAKYYYIDKNNKVLEKCNFCNKRLTEQQFDKCVSENISFACDKCIIKYGIQFINSIHLYYKCKNCEKITYKFGSKRRRVRRPILDPRRPCDCTQFGPTIHAVKLINKPKYIKIKKEMI